MAPHAAISLALNTPRPPRCRSSTGIAAWAGSRGLSRGFVGWCLRLDRFAHRES